MMGPNFSNLPVNWFFLLSFFDDLLLKDQIDTLYPCYGIGDDYDDDDDGILQILTRYVLIFL